MATVPRDAPRYRQVADVLQRSIEAGDLRPHDRLDSERTIAERHGLSRMTARQAIELLVRRGTVYRRPGSGTFVSPPRIVHTLQRLAGFSEQMRAQGIAPSSRVLEMRSTGRVDAAVRCALDLSADDRAWLVRRVRYGDGEPLLLETFWVPAALCPDITRADLAEGSLYALLRERYGIDPCSADEAIEPAVLDPGDARHLDARPGSPAVLVTRTTRDSEGRAVEFARDLYRGDRARFEVSLRA
ncbi:MAG TPA: GntR family transcriptional regulator [Gaiellales bacterium]|nr:GntR family transcriptional regulator [Gaiellales bacterium]